MIDRDTVIKLAREAHWVTATGGMPTTSPWWGMDVPALERFAAMVAAAEREACYQIALTIGDDDAGCRHTDEVARRIRARGNT